MPSWVLASSQYPPLTLRLSKTAVNSVTMQVHVYTAHGVGRERTSLSAVASSCRGMARTSCFRFGAWQMTSHAPGNKPFSSYHSWDKVTCGSAEQQSATLAYRISLQILSCDARPYINRGLAISGNKIFAGENHHESRACCVLRAELVN